MGRDILIPANRQSSLPTELPDNLVYWIRCETKVKAEGYGAKLINNDQLQVFYRTKVSLEDEIGGGKKDKEKVSPKDGINLELQNLLETQNFKQEQFLNNQNEQNESRESSEGSSEGNSQREILNLSSEQKIQANDGEVKQVVSDDCETERLENLRIREFQESLISFQDNGLEAFVNKQESRIYNSIKRMPPHRLFEIEGTILLDGITENHVFFNSKFESGNLRQAFKVPSSFLPQVITTTSTVGNIQGQTNAAQSSASTDASDPLSPQSENLDLPLRDQKQLNTSSANISQVKTIIPEYKLYLQDDTNNDNSLTQWFYFSVMNIRRGLTIKLVIDNLMKDDSLYSNGMKPFVYSTKKKEQSGVGWHRGGFDISYNPNGQTIRTSSKTLDHEFDPSYVENVGDKFKQNSSLTFHYTFEHDYDTVFFAHFVPYTYSDLSRYLMKVRENESLQHLVRVDALCKSLCGNVCYSLTITNDLQESFYPSSLEEIHQFKVFEYYKGKDPNVLGASKEKKKRKRKTKEEGNNGNANNKNKRKSGGASVKKIVLDASMTLKQVVDQVNVKSKVSEQDLKNDIRKQSEAEIESKHKSVIFITSRVHPGESNASYLSHGLIDFLLSDAQEAFDLREKFIFKIVPMLNPDGVIYGNYRSSLLGVDLNRRWKNPSKYLHPTIYYSKQMLKWLNGFMKHPQQFNSTVVHGVVMSCDFHGHSRKKNVFMYGCYFPTNEIMNPTNQIIHAVPEQVAQVCPIFNFKDCKFACEKEKETTARIVLYRELGILNSYTLETTFYGSEFFRNPQKRLQSLSSFTIGNSALNGGAPAQSSNWVNPIDAPRDDIHISWQDLIEVGKDFAKGINLASEVRVIQNSWYPYLKKINKEKRSSLTKLSQNQVQMNPNRNIGVLAGAIIQQQKRISEAATQNGIPIDPKYKSGYVTRRYGYGENGGAGQGGGFNMNISTNNVLQSQLNYAATGFQVVNKSQNQSRENLQRSQSKTKVMEKVILLKNQIQDKQQDGNIDHLEGRDNFKDLKRLQKSKENFNQTPIDGLSEDSQLNQKLAIAFGGGVIVSPDSSRVNNISHSDINYPQRYFQAANQFAFQGMSNYQMNSKQPKLSLVHHKSATPDYVPSNQEQQVLLDSQLQQLRIQYKNQQLDISNVKNLMQQYSTSTTPNQKEQRLNLSNGFSQAVKNQSQNQNKEIIQMLDALYKDSFQKNSTYFKNHLIQEKINASMSKTGAGFNKMALGQHQQQFPEPTSLAPQDDKDSHHSNPAQLGNHSALHQIVSEHNLMS